MKTKFFIASIAAVAISVAGFGQSKFAKTHPRRAEVNSRVRNQNARVDNKVANGKMSKAEAAKIHHQDRAIHREQKRDAAVNHGHITKAEKAHINHQENHVSHEIKNH